MGILPLEEDRMDIIDIIPTYERLLRDAAITSLEVDDFDLRSDIPDSVVEFAELEREAKRATMALLDFFHEEAHMLRLLVGSPLAKQSKDDLTKLSKLPREDLIKALEG